MPRFFTLALALLAATPAMASADECMLSSVGRGEVSGISVADPLVETFGNESVDVELEIRLGLRQLPSLGADDAGGMLWCLSPDDPRCTPIDGPTEAPSLVDPMPASAAPVVPDLAERDRSAVQFVSRHDDGPLGIFARVERPPRG